MTATSSSRGVTSCFKEPSAAWSVSCTTGNLTDTPLNSGMDPSASISITFLRKDFFFFFGEDWDACTDDDLALSSSEAECPGLVLTFTACKPSPKLSKLSIVRGEILGGGGAGGKLSMSSSGGSSCVNEWA